MSEAESRQRAEISQQAHYLLFEMLKLGPLGERVPSELLPILAAALRQAYREGEESMRAYCDTLKADRDGCYREGVEAMRDAALKVAAWHTEQNIIEKLDSAAARLLEQEGGK